MKKIFFIHLCIYTLLNASNDYELKLFETILPSIFKQQPITVYLDNDMSLLLQDSVKFKIVQSCNSSVVILIGKNFNNLSTECKNKPIFATSYRDYKNDNSFGAFYWRKGRPQLKFKRAVLKRYNLVLPDNLQRYKQ